MVSYSDLQTQTYDSMPFNYFMSKVVLLGQHHQPKGLKKKLNVQYFAVQFTLTLQTH